ncbi:RES domain-containing protein [Rudanella paleaurantiibacter]|uniref:RES domain-containing protein n=1 Tax=Rudanella paleaurantiibacter TaxID=2614655 RepID=A0A7J5TSF1_9BACT|nr:RES family NAD+ phosphorylase [Rudanella paleaurantiibacter]KAB7725493.1 RES domain-containing protein [Rudanella paleaurantiibacter]
MAEDPILLYRIQTDAHRDTILDGIGARMRGGRWNAKGRPMVYTATTPELCFLEYMVHLEGTPLADLPPLILCEIAVPAKCITYLDVHQLPNGWDSPYATPDGLPQFADEQFRRHNTLALAIPSAVVPLSPSRNVLVDPLHPLRAACQVVRIIPYPIDPRLPTA